MINLDRTDTPAGDDYGTGICRIGITVTVHLINLHCHRSWNDIEPAFAQSRQTRAEVSRIAKRAMR